MAADEPLAVIIGGTSGIGLASAQRLLEDGYQVLVTGRDGRRGRAAVTTLRQKGIANFMALDSARFEDYPKLVQAVAGRSVQALVISAAVGVQARITDTDSQTFMEMLAVNVVAPLEFLKVLSPVMTPPAAAVLISSDAGIDGEQALGAYSVTKAALNMLGRMAALDLASAGVRVNIVCPGDTEPGMRHLLRPGEAERSPHDSASWPIPPRGRLGQAQDTADMVAYLVSPRADFITGSVIVVDGGSRAGRSDHR